MNFFKEKPGVILLPVSAVLVIFVVLLILLIDQKQSNNALVLEYRAGGVIDLLLDLYEEEQDLNPSEIDENIKGYGIYDLQGQAVFRYGSAPEILPKAQRRNSEVLLDGNRSIIIIRQAFDGSMLFPGMGMQMQRMSPFMQRRLDELRQKRTNPNAPPPGRFQAGVYLEYVNSSYIAELRLIIIIVGLFVVLFAGAFVLVYRLYRTNRRLLVKAEHDRQLIQLGEAARTLAHEIRNPLGALKIQRDLLKKKLPEEYEGNLLLIDRELKRLNVLVERVGEFLRNPVGSPETINLSEFIEDLYRARSEVELVAAEEPKSRDCSVLFDRERLRTVLDNLVNNAVESGGRAELKVEYRARRTRLIVRDNGAGFTDEALERLYDPFYTTKNSGTGLGLSVVKRLVDSSGGSVQISNRVEGGAEVIIIFGDKNESSDSGR